jgi:tetratricopeptide (TPR) repeat protein
VYTAEDLRSDIRQAELSVANVRSDTTPEKLLDLLHLLDALATGYAQLDQRGVDLRAERSRLDTVHNILESKDRIVAHVLAPRGGLPQVRAEVHPPPDHQWWYLDLRVAQRRAKRLRRLAWGSLIAAVVLAVLTVLYVRFLRPDETTRQRISYTFDAESAAQRGDFRAALDAYSRALELAPDDAEIQMMVGVMHEALGEIDQATTAYTRAEALYGSRATFLAMRSQQYGVLGWYDQAEADALEAIELDDQLPFAYCSLGSAYEGQEKVPQAIDAFQACADLARQQGQNELYVIATTRLAYLMQRP